MGYWCEYRWGEVRIVRHKMLCVRRRCRVPKARGSHFCAEHTTYLRELAREGKTDRGGTPPVVSGDSRGRRQTRK